MEDLSSLLEPIRARHDLPGLAGSIVADGRTQAIGATGERARGGGDPVRIDDRWHLASCTKAMTATLVALLVEEGQLSWETTLGEVFPAETAGQPAWRPVTIEQLLRHRSGLRGDAWFEVSLEGPVPNQRRAVVRAGLSNPPSSTPGQEMVYSNAGYVVAGSILEVRTGTSWEDLMRTRLFERLGMTSAGFGLPRPLPQPVGHWKRVPLGVDSNADNPPVLGPAAGVHASLEDWGKFVALHLTGNAGGSDLLLPGSFKRMHSPPPGGDYASGWIAVHRPWGGQALTHTGSNGFWISVVWAAPERNFAVLVATNEAGEHAMAGTSAAVEALIGHYLRSDGVRNDRGTSDTATRWEDPRLPSPANVP